MPLGVGAENGRDERVSVSSYLHARMYLCSAFVRVVPYVWLARRKAQGRVLQPHPPPCLPLNPKPRRRGGGSRASIPIYGPPTTNRTLTPAVSFTAHAQQRSASSASSRASLGVDGRGLVLG